MPRKLTIDDYKRAGATKGLDFIGEIHDPAELHRLGTEFDYYAHGSLPSSSSESTYWRCRVTGKIIHKQLATVHRREYGSRYQREFWGTFRRYKNLAKKLGIAFLYDPDKEFFPATTKDRCRWLGRNGKEVLVSYHHLGYDFIAAETKELLGLPQNENVVYELR